MRKTRNISGDGQASPLPRPLPLRREKPHPQTPPPSAPTEVHFSRLRRSCSSPSAYTEPSPMGSCSWGTLSQFVPLKLEDIHPWIDSHMPPAGLRLHYCLILDTIIYGLCFCYFFQLCVVSAGRVEVVCDLPQPHNRNIRSDRKATNVSFV